MYSIVFSSFEVTTSYVAFSICVLFNALVITFEYVIGLFKPVRQYHRGVYSSSIPPSPFWTNANSDFDVQNREFFSSWKGWEMM